MTEQHPTDVFAEYSDLDVLHLTFFHSKRTAVAKVIDNLVTNLPEVRQKVISLSECDLNLSAVLNAVKPKILHLHYNGPHPESAFLDELRYQPVMMQTVHSDNRSIFSDVLDQIICIDEPGRSKNDPSKTILIEDTVDVSGFPRHRPNGNGICNALRFSPDQMEEETFDLFARIQARVFFYGADDLLSFAPTHNQALCDYVRRYDHISCLPYIPNMEEKMVEHAFLSYYLRHSNPHRAYGLIVMEAASLGMPIVALRKAQPFQRYIIDGFNGFIADQDEDFIRACERLCQDAGLYAALCANAQAHARTLKNCMPESYRRVYHEWL